jgi:hypothetical protein
MHDKTIDALGCLRGHRAMGCFPFLCVGVLDVSTSRSLSSQLNYGFSVMYLSCISSCCVYPTIGFYLVPLDFVLSMSTPFVLWDASTLGGCCGFLVANGSWPRALPCESMSIPTIVRTCPSSSTSVVLTSSVCGEGIALTSTIPSICVKSCSASAVSCSDLWLLRVFRAV